MDVTTSSILLEWQRPAVVPGMLRYYNISYRVLNISDSEVVELSMPGSATSYLIDDLTGLMLCEINITAVTIDAGPVETVRAMTLEGRKFWYFKQGFSEKVSSTMCPNRECHSGNQNKEPKSLFIKIQFLKKLMKQEIGSPHQICLRPQLSPLGHRSRNDIQVKMFLTFSALIFY